MEKEKRRNLYLLSKLGYQNKNLYLFKTLSLEIKLLLTLIKTSFCHSHTLTCCYLIFNNMTTFLFACSALKCTRLTQEERKRILFSAVIWHSYFIPDLREFTFYT